jgi:flagellar basal body-associated protein FliL
MPKMVRKQASQDKELRKGIALVAAIVTGALAIGAVTHYFWQDDRPKKIKEPATRYLSLGEQAIGIGHHSVLIQFSVEYEGRGTEDSLKKVMPSLKHQVLNRMAQIKTSDLKKLRTPQGKQELAEDMRVLVQEKLPPEDARNIKGVLYEKFLIGD